MVPGNPLVFSNIVDSKKSCGVTAVTRHYNGDNPYIREFTVSFA